MKKYHFLNEGGNAIKSSQPIPAEIACQLADKIAEKISKELNIRTAVYGSAGKKKNGQTHGDLDIGIEMPYNEVSLKLLKDTVYKLFGPNVIEEKDSKGFKLWSFGYRYKYKGETLIAQVDCMFSDNITIGNFAYHSPNFAKDESNFKGLFRTKLLDTIISMHPIDINKYPQEFWKEEFDGKYKGQLKRYWKYSFDFELGVVIKHKTFESPAAKPRGPVKTPTTIKKDTKLFLNNPIEITKWALGADATLADVNSFETIVNYIIKHWVSAKVEETLNEYFKQLSQIKSVEDDSIERARAYVKNAIRTINEDIASNLLIYNYKKRNINEAILKFNDISTTDDDLKSLEELNSFVERKKNIVQNYKFLYDEENDQKIRVICNRKTRAVALLNTETYEIDEVLGEMQSCSIAPNSSTVRIFGDILVNRLKIVKKRISAFKPKSFSNMPRAFYNIYDIQNKEFLSPYLWFETIDTCICGRNILKCTSALYTYKYDIKNQYSIIGNEKVFFEAYYPYAEIYFSYKTLDVKTIFMHHNCGYKINDKDILNKLLHDVDYEKMFKSRFNISQLNTEVNEKFLRFDDTVEDKESSEFKFGEIVKKYNYYPKTKEELRKILKKLIEERGPEGDFNDIYTGQITDMSELFKKCSDFNGNISNWDVSNVENMSYMFADCTSFNQDLSNWDVSNVENMSYMFVGCTSFNQDLSNWDVSSVKDMSYMFNLCESFNQDLSNWDVSNVENMFSMFYWCTSFNQDLSNWDVSNVKNMSFMFAICTSFNQDLSNWDVSNVENMSFMFARCTSFNQDLSNWDVSNVENMFSMFSWCESFNQDLSNWDVSNVKNMSYMFDRHNKKFLIPIWYF